MTNIEIPNNTPLNIEYVKPENIAVINTVRPSAVFSQLTFLVFSKSITATMNKTGPVPESGIFDHNGKHGTDIANNKPQTTADKPVLAPDKIATALSVEGRMGPVPTQCALIL